ncbi:MAG: hypothetical protein ACTSP5_02905 [Candidatus Heimdallarchaeota archaeon]
MISNDVLAVILGTIANSIYNIGLVLKKKGACTLPDIEDNSVWQNIKNFSKCKIWVIGANMIGSLSLVAPTMGIGIIVLIIFSWFYLKEKIRPVEIIGIIAIIAATVALNVVGPASPGKYSLKETNLFFAEPNAIIFMCIYAYFDYHSLWKKTQNRWTFFGNRFRSRLCNGHYFRKSRFW